MCVAHRGTSTCMQYACLLLGKVVASFADATLNHNFIAAVRQSMIITPVGAWHILSQGQLTRASRGMAHTFRASLHTVCLVV